MIGDPRASLIVCTLCLIAGLAADPFLLVLCASRLFQLQGLKFELEVE